MLQSTCFSWPLIETNCIESQHAIITSLFRYRCSYVYSAVWCVCCLLSPFAAGSEGCFSGEQGSSDEVGLTRNAA